jgi:hypothetical protein
MSRVYEKGLVGGDFIIMESDAAFTRDSKTIDNSAGEDDLVLEAGYPMDDNVPEVAANHAQVDGFLVEGVTVPAGEKRKVAVLARGPAVVNLDALPVNDYAGDPWSHSNLQAAIEALDADIVFRREPTKKETQTT